MSGQAFVNADFSELNPFVPSAGHAPRELLGRDEELAAMDRLIARTKLGLASQGTVYTGLRGVGKTVLLNQLQKLAREQGFLTVKVEAVPDEGPDSVYCSLVDTIQLSVPMVTHVGFRQHLLEGLESFRSLSLSAFGVQLSLGGQSGADQSDGVVLSLQLRLLVQRITEVAHGEGHGFILFVDELQDLNPQVMGTLITVQHELGQLGLPFYVIGAGLPSLPGVLSKQRSYAERLFDYRVIGRLSEPDTRAVFEKTAESIGHRFEDAALDRLTQLSGGYPFFIQAFGAQAWAAASGSPIRLESVEASVPAAWEYLDHGLYSARWLRATPAGQEYLRALASLGEMAPTRDVAKAMGKSLAQVSQFRAQLIDLGLIYQPEVGQVAFTVPGMGEFIHRQDRHNN